MVASSRTFNCEQCGGAALPVAGREYLQCEYCRSLVFHSENPLTVDRVVPENGVIEADCPVCAKPLLAGSIENQPILYCNCCYGFLLKNEDFGSIVRQRRARREGCEAEAVKPLDTAQYDRQLNCPACAKLMEVHPYYGPGNVVIDSCSRCHYVWLDHAELRRIERAEGGKEPAPLPLHVNESGDLTIIPPPETTSRRGYTAPGSRPQTLSDLLMDLW